MIQTGAAASSSLAAATIVDGTAAALVFFGRLHDVTGSYDIALTVGAAAFGMGAIAFASIGRLR